MTARSANFLLARRSSCSRVLRRQRKRQKEHQSQSGEVSKKKKLFEANESLSEILFTGFFGRAAFCCAQSDSVEFLLFSFSFAFHARPRKTVDRKKPKNTRQGEMSTNTLADTRLCKADECIKSAEADADNNKLRQTNRIISRSLKGLSRIFCAHHIRRFGRLSTGDLCNSCALEARLDGSALSLNIINCCRSGAFRWCFALVF
jgi:hypothetical protein